MSQRTLFCLAFFPVVLASGLVLLAVPKFADMYLAFGTALPIPTQLLFQWYAAFALLPFAFLVPWFTQPAASERGLYSLLLSSFVSISVIALGAWACYLPLLTSGHP